MAGVLNFTLDQGTDKTVSIQLTTKDGTPLNLTGYTNFRCDLRLTPQDALIASPIVSPVDLSVARIKIDITKAQSSSIITKGKFYNDYTVIVYDIEADNPDGKRERLVNGNIKVSPEVTKDA